MNSTEASEDVEEVVKNSSVKVEGDHAALDCSRNSRGPERPLDSVLTALQESSKRKQPGSDGQPDSVPSGKRRRLIPEIYCNQTSVAPFSSNQNISTAPNPTNATTRAGGSALQSTAGLLAVSLSLLHLYC